MARELLTLASGDSICTIAPSNGGSLASWQVGGQPMLRTAAPDSDVLGSASFPLVPYSNRVGHARFSWNGRTIMLPPHPAAMPHAHHGVGWITEWTPENIRPDSVTLTLHHHGDDHWPWPFMARQRVKISADRLELGLSVTNLADEAAPLAFGHHPFFDSDGARLKFKADHYYPTDADNLPTQPCTPADDFDFSTSRDVAGCVIDTVYGKWNGVARIDWQNRERALEMRSSLPHAVLYTPPGEDYFCFEPVPHVTNALNRADGDMPIVEPSKSLETWIEMRAVI